MTSASTLQLPISPSCWTSWTRAMSPRRQAGNSMSDSSISATSWVAISLPSGSSYGFIELITKLLGRSFELLRTTTTSSSPRQLYVTWSTTSCSPKFDFITLPSPRPLHAPCRTSLDFSTHAMAGFHEYERCTGLPTVEDVGRFQAC